MEETISLRAFCGWFFLPSFRLFAASLIHVFSFLLSHCTASDVTRQGVCSNDICSSTEFAKKKPVRLCAFSMINQLPKKDKDGKMN